MPVETKNGRHTVASDLAALVIHTQAIPAIVVEKTTQDTMIHRVLVLIVRIATVDLAVAAG